MFPTVVGNSKFIQSSGVFHSVVRHYKDTVTFKGVMIFHTLRKEVNMIKWKENRL